MPRFRNGQLFGSKLPSGGGGLLPIPGGQVLTGGTLDGDDLGLDSTLSAVKGRLVAYSSLVPTGDDQFQVGEAGRRFHAAYFNDLVTGDLNLKSKDAHWKFIEKKDHVLVLNVKTEESFKLALEKIND